mmetsp:Transcript_9645/g.24919  ORF Transcript_9645/g.24919 Transcript_9645/m.24919 type:complete len:206 (+) Transcript_9645:2618-3235(+)
MRASAATGSVVFMTVSDSPVSAPSSVRTDVVLSLITRTSAGILSPTLICTTSPGTSSAAGSSGMSWPSRTHWQVHSCRLLSASSAFSALCSCHTPTIALSTRMRRMTNGSTNAWSPSSPSSKKARTKERVAAPSRILTSRSSNCCSTSFHSGVPSSCSSSFGPYSALSFSICAELRPLASVTLCEVSTCSGLCDQLGISGCALRR